MRTELALEAILALPAGRELDVLVAEKVMGLSVEDYHYPIAWKYVEVPHYSTSIAAAWEVVEKLKSTFTLDRTGRAVGFDLNYSSIFKIWSVNLIVDEMGPVERVDADTAPLAICRAALKAVMR